MATVLNETGYSHLVEVRILNFMSLKDAKVRFDESNVINLKGYNDSGKSNVLRAMEVCLMNKYPQSQAKFITDGEDEFKVEAEFSDGVVITRVKYRTGQSYYEMTHNGEVVVTTRVGRSLSKVTGVPQEIADYLGLCVTDSVYLNSRSNADKQLLVETTGSENFQSLNEVLKTEELYRAITMLNADRNNLTNEISNLEFQVNNLGLSLASSRWISTDLVNRLAELESLSETTHMRKTKATGLSEDLARVGQLKVTPELKPVDLTQIESVANLRSQLRAILELKTPPQAKPVEGIERISSLEALKSLVNQVLSVRVLEAEVPAVSEVTLEKLNLAAFLLKELARLKEVNAELEKYAQLQKKADTAVENLRLSLEKQGKTLISCESCGELSLVEKGTSALDSIGHTH